MGGLPTDISRSIERSFAIRDHEAARELLTEHQFVAPHVLRAVLHLADGSIELLESYLQRCQVDARKVLLEAQRALGIREVTLHAIDRSAGLGSGGEVTRGPQRVVGGSAAAPAEGPPAAKSAAAPGHHAALVRRRFQLGDITYVVMSDQPCASYVRCFRMAGTVTTLVQLPLSFVLEQLAEHIVMTDTFGTA